MAGDKEIAKKAGAVIVGVVFVEWSAKLLTPQFPELSDLLWGGGRKVHASSVTQKGGRCGM